jgi:hypothetical protein
MKKIFIAIISAMILMPMMADAQIQKKATTKIETLLSLRMGYMNLKLSEGTYFISMLTTNQFDDAMVLKLGETKESAAQSLNDLMEISTTISGQECVRIDNGYGRELRFYKGAMGGVTIQADGYAGVVNTAKSEFKKMLDKLSKK